MLWCSGLGQGRRRSSRRCLCRGLCCHHRGHQEGSALFGGTRVCQMLCVCGHRHPPPRGRESCGDMLTSVPFKTVWPSGLRRWLQAPVRKGVGLNPTAVISELQVPDIQYARATGSTRLCSSAAPSLSETAPPPSPPESGPHMWLQILSKRLQRQPWPLPRLIFPKNRAPPYQIPPPPFFV